MLKEVQNAIEALRVYHRRGCEVAQAITGGDRYLATVEAYLSTDKPVSGPSKFVRNLGAVFLDVDSGSNRVVSCSSHTNSSDDGPGGGGATPCSCNPGTMNWANPQTNMGSCPEGGWPSGTTSNFYCTAGGSGRKLCVTGSWVNIAPCPKDGE